jgi:hypothetical protein
MLNRVFYVVDSFCIGVKSLAIHCSQTDVEESANRRQGLQPLTGFIHLYQLSPFTLFCSVPAPPVFLFCTPFIGLPNR